MKSRIIACSTHCSKQKIWSDFVDFVRLNLQFRFENMNCPNRNRFCYVCGLFAPAKHNRNITNKIITAFEGYFKIAYVPNLWYIPEVVCDYCHRSLSGWNNKTHRSKFVQPMVWLPRTEHSPNHCYFCINTKKSVGFRYITRESMIHETVESVLPAILRSAEYPYSQSEQPDAEPQDEFEFAEHFDDPGEGTSAEGMNTRASTTNTSLFSLTRSENEALDMQHLITQADFNDLVRDSGLSSKGAMLWASRLQQWRLVAPGFRVTALQSRSNENCNKSVFDECFSVHDPSKITYCNDIDKLFQNLGHPYDPDEWRLFIDSSVESLKGVLLHIGNDHPSVPIIYARGVPEKYETMVQVLELINYDSHGWRICCDLKIVAILTGVKQGFSKHQCFLCLWEGRQRELHYTDHRWQVRDNYRIGVGSIDHEPLIPASKVILPPLHIKLGMIKNFVKALNPDSEAFKMLKTIFPKLSDAKIKEGWYELECLSHSFANELIILIDFF